MAIRKLLLPLTGTAAGEAALSTCPMIPRLWTAHVTALHVRVDSAMSRRWPARACLGR